MRKRGMLLVGLTALFNFTRRLIFPPRTAGRNRDRKPKWSLVYATTVALVALIGGGLLLEAAFGHARARGSDCR